MVSFHILITAPVLFQAPAPLSEGLLQSMRCTHTHPCDFIALCTYMMANEGKFEAWGR